MLSFDRGSLATQAARVDGELDADDPVWREGDEKPAGPIRVSGRLSTAGEGRFYFSGHFDGMVETGCRRCLSSVRAPVADDAHLLFADAGDEEADDADVYLLDPRAREVDLRPALREQWLLAVPRFPLCREDCKGLCPRCGADLNDGPCDCKEIQDSRWDALRSVPRDR